MNTLTLTLMYVLIGLALGLWLTLIPRFRHRWHSHPDYFCHGRPCGSCWSMVPLSVVAWPIVAILTACMDNSDTSEEETMKPLSVRVYQVAAVAAVVLVVAAFAHRVIVESEREQRLIEDRSLSACSARMQIARTSTDSLYALASLEPSRRERQCQWVLDRGQPPQEKP